MSISVIIIRVRCMDVSSVVETINFNRDDGFNLNYAWRPIIKILQTSNSAPMANPGQVQVENQPRPQGHRRDLYK
jgi:hypothetical protein